MHENPTLRGQVIADIYVRNVYNIVMTDTFNNILMICKGLSEPL